MGTKLYGRALSIPLDAFREEEEARIHIARATQRRNKLAVAFLASIADDETGAAWCNDAILAAVLSMSRRNIAHRAAAMQRHGMFIRAKLQVVRGGATLNAGVAAYSLTLLTGSSAPLEEIMMPYLDAYLDTPYGPVKVLDDTPEWAWTEELGSIMIKQQVEAEEAKKFGG